MSFKLLTLVPHDGTSKKVVQKMVADVVYLSAPLLIGCICVIIFVYSELRVKYCNMFSGGVMMSYAWQHERAEDIE